MQVRYSSPPTKYDIAPYGTLVKLMKDNDEFDYYIQLSVDETVANWLSMAQFLEKIFSECYHNEYFIKECLKLYEQNIEHETPSILSHLFTPR